MPQHLTVCQPACKSLTLKGSRAAYSLLQLPITVFVIHGMHVMFLL